MGRHETQGEVSAVGAHATDTPDATTSKTISGVLGSPRFWMAPLILVVAVFSLMAAVYMGAIADPERNLHDFPIALVNEDSGAEVDSGDGQSTRQNFGQQVADGIAASAAGRGFNVDRTDRIDALDKLNSGKVYGAVVIDPNFTARAVALGRSAVLQAKPEPLAIDVYINRGSGTFASAVTTELADQVDEQVNQEVGARLLDTVRGQLARADVPLSGAAQLALSTPVAVKVVEATPLPQGSGNGLSAFYFTLLLVLAGFTGAMMVSIVVDGMLGQTPIEYGPFYQLRMRLAISRWATLAAKWVIMLLVALVQSALFIGVCAAVGTALPNAFSLWAFSVLAIWAVGVSASSMMAVFGNPGLIVNLLFFVILGLPSSGGTVPLEASPRLFTWLAAIEPMHLIYLGVRAIMYFDADWSAGLARSVIQTAGGLLVGLLIGWAGTTLYDRKRWHRFPGGMTLSPRLARMLDSAGSTTITRPSPEHVAAAEGVPVSNTGRGAPNGGRDRSPVGE